MGVDYSQLPDDMKAFLQKVEANSPHERQLRALEHLATMMQMAVDAMNQVSEEILDDTSQSKQQFTEVKKLLAALDKQAPALPDFSKPVIESLKRLETSLTKAIATIDVQPPDVTVQAPEVVVDMTEVNRILKRDIPAAFRDAIALIPTVELPETDLTGLEQRLEALQPLLQSIDTASRMKPQFPTVMKVTSNDGGSLSGLRAGEDYDLIDAQQTSATVETYVYKLAGTTVQTITVTYTDSTKGTLDTVAYS